MVYRRTFYRFATFGMAALILAVSSIPYLPQPELHLQNNYELRLDYFFHFLVYFIPAVTAAIWLSGTHGRLTPSRLILILIAGVLFGAADELHQLFIPGRRFNPVDFMSNAMGFITGTLLTYFIFIRNFVVVNGRWPRFRKMLFPES